MSATHADHPAAEKALSPELDAPSPSPILEGDRLHVSPSPSPHKVVVEEPRSFHRRGE